VIIAWCHWANSQQLSTETTFPRPRYNGCMTLRDLRLRWVKHRKNEDFRPINSYISETMEDRHVVTTEESACRFFSWYTIYNITRRSTTGDRALAVAGPRAWNNLTEDLRLSRLFSTSKTHLKSHLFNISFSSVWLYHWLFFVQRPRSRLCCMRLSKFVIIALHYITIPDTSRHTCILPPNNQIYQ